MCLECLEQHGDGSEVGAQCGWDRRRMRRMRRVAARGSRSHAHENRDALGGGMGVRQWDGGPTNLRLELPMTTLGLFHERFGLGVSQASASPLELSAVQVSGLDRSATRVVATCLCFAPVRSRSARSGGPSVFQSLR